MKCEFVVGQKVVCIKEDAGPEGGFYALTDYLQPIVGKIYTIREMKIGSFSGRVGLKLEEIPDQRILMLKAGVIGSCSMLWEPENFRPLQRRKADISIFKAMLTPAGRIPVDA